MPHALLLICAYLLLLYAVVRLVSATRRRHHDDAMFIFTTTELPPQPMPITINFSDDSCIIMLDHALGIAEDTAHHMFMPIDADLNVHLKDIPCQHCGHVALHLNHLSLTKEELLS